RTSTWAASDYAQHRPLCNHLDAQGAPTPASFDKLRMREWGGAYPQKLALATAPRDRAQARKRPHGELPELVEGRTTRVQLSASTPALTLARKFFRCRFQPAKGERIHAPVEQLADHADRRCVAPGALFHRIEPDRMGPLLHCAT